MGRKAKKKKSIIALIPPHLYYDCAEITGQLTVEICQDEIEWLRKELGDITSRRLYKMLHFLRLV